MKLLEYQVKNLFRRYGIPVPVGKVASSAREVKNIAEEIGKPVVIKAQIPVIGRGEKGGIRVARSAVEAETISSEMMAGRIDGFPVHKVQVDEALAIQDEYFVVLTIDRATRYPALILYTDAQKRIEAAANAIDEKDISVSIDPLIGLQRYQIRNLARQAGFPPALLSVFTNICLQMWSFFTQVDARYVALSPLVITEHQRVIALDGKIALDRCALFRQSFIADHANYILVSENELEAFKQGFVYLDFGNEKSIACLANGAGLTLATMDYVVEAGGTVSDLVDVGARTLTDHSNRALTILLRDEKIQAVVVNIYGCMTSCGEIAKRLLSAWEEADRRVPVFVNFDGYGKMEANSLLQNSGIIVCSSLEDAVNSAVAQTKEMTG